MERLVADIQHQLSGDWALLGPAAANVPSFSLDWGPDTRLRLPRMEDLLFGISVHFPLIDVEGETGEDIGSRNAAEASERELAASPDSCLTTSDSSSSPNKTLTPASDPGTAHDNYPTTNDVLVIDVHAVQNNRCSSNGSPHASLVDIRDTALRAETPKSGRAQQPEDQGESMLSDSHAQPASAQEILRTHSRAEILLELEWARQALHDRRKYLRSRRRVEQATTVHEAK